MNGHRKILHRTYSLCMIYKKGKPKKAIRVFQNKILSGVKGFIDFIKLSFAL